LLFGRARKIPSVSKSVDARAFLASNDGASENVPR